MDVHHFVARLADANLLTFIAMMVAVSAEEFRESNIDFLIPEPFGYAQLEKLVEEAGVLCRRLGSAETPEM
jgi:hypothetical protein